MSPLLWTDAAQNGHQLLTCGGSLVNGTGGGAELVIGLQLLNWLKKPLRWSAEEAGVHTTPYFAKIS